MACRASGGTAGVFETISSAAATSVATITASAFSAAPPLTREMPIVLPDTAVVNRSSGRPAGPAIGTPAASKTPPWQGHSKRCEAADQFVSQPACEHRREIASYEPPGAGRSSSGSPPTIRDAPSPATAVVSTDPRILGPSATVVRPVATAAAGDGPNVTLRCPVSLLAIPVTEVEVRIVTPSSRSFPSRARKMRSSLNPPSQRGIDPRSLGTT